MAERIKVVTVTDPETGESAQRELDPGQYAVVCAEPMYLDSKQVYRNGTVVLTLKRRAREHAVEVGGTGGPAGEALGTRRHDPRHAAGDWQTDRDTPPEHQGGGPRPPLRDNLPKETPR